MSSLRPHLIGVSLSVLGGMLLLAASARPAWAQAAAPGVGSPEGTTVVAVVVPPPPAPLPSPPSTPAVRVVDVSEGLEIPPLVRYDYPFPAAGPPRDGTCGARTASGAPDGDAGRTTGDAAVLS